MAIMGFNRPEWTMSDLAAMAAGGVPVGIYTSSASEQIAYILNNASVRLAVIENASRLERVMAVRGQIESLERIVLMEGDVDDPDVLSWSEFLAMADAVPDEDLEARLDALRPGDLAALIYTSGTTGPPKGSMLTHGNLAYATGMGGELLPPDTEIGRAHV